MNSINIVMQHYPAGCPSCGTFQVTSQEASENFEYGQGGDKLSLSARFPVYTCAHCNFAFTDHLAEERRHDAVCLALGILKPSEVKAIRERLNLSQAEFADISGIGKASLGRWERGIVVQNESSDNLLRLLSYPENIARLKNKGKIPQASNVVPFERKFKALSQAGEGNLRKRASAFQLNA